MTRKLHTVGAELEKISLTTDKSVIVLINLGEVTTRRKNRTFIRSVFFTMERRAESIRNFIIKDRQKANLHPLYSSNQ